MGIFNCNNFEKEFKNVDRPKYTFSYKLAKNMLLWRLATASKMCNYRKKILRKYKSMYSKIILKKYACSMYAIKS